MDKSMRESSGRGATGALRASFDVPHVTSFFKRGPDRTTVEYRYRYRR